MGSMFTNINVYCCECGHKMSCFGIRFGSDIVTMKYICDTCGDKDVCVVELTYD